KIANEKDGLLAELKARDTTIENLVIGSEINAALAEFGGKPFLAKIIRDVVRLEKTDDGKIHTIVIDENGSPRVNAKGEPLKVSEFVGEMRSSDDFGPAFKGVGASGSGMPPVGG